MTWTMRHCVLFLVSPRPELNWDGPPTRASAGLREIWEELVFFRREILGRELKLRSVATPNPWVLTLAGFH